MNIKRLCGPRLKRDEHYTFTWNEELQKFEGYHHESEVKATGDSLKDARIALYKAIDEHYEKQKQLVREVFGK